MDEEPNEQPLILAKASHAAIPPPPILGGPSGWCRSEIVDAAPRWLDREPEKAKKKKKSRWIATPDCVLPTETFDEHAKDTMMKSGLYTWTVGSANETGDKWKYIASTGDVVKGDAVVEGESRIYSARAYQLLSKAAGPKDKPATQEQLRQELDANTALISKVATWTKAGLTANYAHKQDDSQKLDWKVKTVFHSAGYSVNTMTGAVQPRMNSGDSSSDSEPLFIDLTGRMMKSKAKLVPRIDAVASDDSKHSVPRGGEDSDDVDAVDPEHQQKQRLAENVRKRLDKEESMDITAEGGFNSNTVDDYEGKHRRKDDAAAAPAAYKWAQRRSRSERARRYSFDGDAGVEANVPAKRKRSESDAAAA